MLLTQCTSTDTVQCIFRTCSIRCVTDIGEVVTVISPVFLMFPIDHTKASQIRCKLPVTEMYFASISSAYYGCEWISFTGSGCTTAFCFCCILLLQIFIGRCLSCTAGIVIGFQVAKIAECSTAEVTTVSIDAASFWCKSISTGASCCCHRYCAVISGQLSQIFCSKSTEHRFRTFGIFYRCFSNGIAVTDGSCILSRKTGDIGIAIQNIGIYQRSIHLTVTDGTLVGSCHTSKIQGSVLSDKHCVAVTAKIEATDCTIQDLSTVHSCQCSHIYGLVITDLSVIFQILIRSICLII